jgi:outer membrane protein TolC
MADGLSLKEAINIIKNSNLEVQVAQHKEAIASFKVKEASGFHLGKLDFTQSVMRTDDAGNVFGFKLASREANFNDFGFDEFLAQMPALQEDPKAGGKLLKTQPKNLNYPDDRDYYQSKITYQIPLYVGGKIVSYEKITSSMEKIAKLDKKSVIKQKIYETKKSFYDMALLKETIKNLKVILDNLATLENMAKEMIKEGYGKDIDLLEVQARKTAVERLINQMESRQKLLYHYLSFLLNRKISNINTVCCIDMDMKTPNVKIENVEKENLTIKMAKTGLQIYNEMLNIEQARYLPEVGAFAEMQTSDDSFLGDADDHKSYTFGMKLTWNIFNGGIDKSAIERAKVEKLQKETEVRLAKEGILLQFNKIITEIENYGDDVKSLKKEFELSNRIYKDYE